MTHWESVCGFTPSARAQLGHAEVARVSKLDELMANARNGAALRESGCGLAAAVVDAGAGTA